MLPGILGVTVSVERIEPMDENNAVIVIST